MSKKGGRTAAESPPAGKVTPSYRPRQAEKSAPCQAGCANCGDIRGWIAIVAQRDKLGLSVQEACSRAWRIIADVNPFPATLGRICPHPCESRCNRGQYDEPLAINAMERFLGDFAIGEGLSLPRLGESGEGRSVAVIGAGPSGLSFAYQMARRGHRVTVYEAREKPGGMLRYGVPDYRLPQSVLDAEIDRIVALGVALVTGQRLGRDFTLESLRCEYDAVYLGIGAQRGLGLDVPGVAGPGVLIGTEFLEAVNDGRQTPIGASVVVVGGGNTAIDAARTARRLGAAATILYRRSREEMPAVAHEVEAALEEGVELVLLAAPTAIRRTEDGMIRAVQASRMQLGEPDSSGRRAPVAREGSDFEVPAETVILAISQVPALDGLEEFAAGQSWLAADEQGVVSDFVLAGGDALHLGIAGNAIVQGRRAAEALHARLTAEAVAPDAPDRPDEPIGSDGVRLESRDHSSEARPPSLAPADRVAAGMAEVVAALDERQFLAEAERCFSCGSCFGCEQCFMYCTSGCFTRLQQPEPGRYFVLNLEACKECGKCVEVCPCGFLEAN